MRLVAPVAAILTCGVALYSTNSVLDQLLVDSRAVRVALVPDLNVLLALTGASALGFGLFMRRLPVLLPVLASAFHSRQYSPTTFPRCNSPRAR
jgi:hypothetical protein